MNKSEQHGTVLTSLFPLLCTKVFDNISKKDESVTVNYSQLLRNVFGNDQRAKQFGCKPICFCHIFTQIGRKTTFYWQKATFLSQNLWIFLTKKFWALSVDSCECKQTWKRYCLTSIFIYVSSLLWMSLSYNWKMGLMRILNSMHFGVFCDESSVCKFRQ